MDHLISLDQAIAMTTAFRKERDSILQPEYQGADYLPNAETFDRAAFDRLLSQPGCAALRIYYGMDDQKRVHAIVVGVNEKNEDMLPMAGTNNATATASDSTTGDGDEGDVIVETGQRCPPDCPPDSPLNP